MICMQVLERVGDGRYETVRETAVQILQKRAAQIRDDPMRHSFLQNVPIHQQLLQM
jgi:hypothetical protein